MVQQATFCRRPIPRYRGIGIWFAPIPLQNYASPSSSSPHPGTHRHQSHLLIKAEIAFSPLIIIVSSIVFRNTSSASAQSPSAVYPTPTKCELQARQTALMQSSTLDAASPAHQQFYQALKPRYLLGSTGLGGALYAPPLVAGRSRDALLRPSPRPGRRHRRRPHPPNARRPPRPLLLRKTLRTPMAPLRPRPPRRLLLRHGPHQHVLTRLRPHLQSRLPTPLLTPIVQNPMTIGISHKTIIILGILKTGGMRSTATTAYVWVESFPLDPDGRSGQQIFLLLLTPMIAGGFIYYAALGIRGVGRGLKSSAIASLETDLTIRSLMHVRTIPWGKYSEFLAPSCPFSSSP